MNIDAAYAIARKAIANVLAGRAADGATPLNKTIPFPRDEDMQFKAGIKLAQLIMHLGPIADDATLTQLTAKLLAHMAKDGYLDRGTVYPLADLVKALCENPTLIGSRAGFGTILRNFRATRANELSWAARAPASPRRLLWSQPPFSLTEVTHPRHLREDALTLHHCLADEFDNDLLNRLERPASRSEKLFALKYWQGIEQREIRILTLLQDDIPAVTIEYRVREKIVSRIQGRHPLAVDHHLIAPLREALHHLAEEMPVRAIHGLPTHH